jgi:hypothetical protein
MNLLELPPSHVRIAYTVSELRELAKERISPVRDPGMYDSGLKIDDYEFLVPPVFPIAAASASSFVYFYGVRYDGSRRADLRPFFLLDFWQNGRRLCPGVFDAEVFRSDAKLAEPDGWIRFDAGCSPTSVDPKIPRLELRVGIRKRIPDPTKTEFSLRLCFKEITPGFLDSPMNPVPL